MWVGPRKRGPGGVRAVGVVRARGGVGTHWQPLNTLQTPRKCEPGLCSGEETRARGGVAVGVVRARGGVGTHWQPLNTLKTPRKCNQVWVVARPGWGVVWAGGGEGARGVWARGGVWARIGSL